MKRRGIYIIAYLCIYACSGLLGQYNYKAVIKSEEGQLIKTKIEIFHHEASVIKIADDLGVVTFENLVAGPHNFTIFAEGFDSLTEAVDLQTDIEQAFKLRPINIELSALEIVAKKKELFTISQLNDLEGTAIYAGKKSEVIHTDLIKGNKANNVGRQMYAQVGGLNIFEGSDGGIQLNIGGRGLDPNRTSNFNTRQNGYDISADVLGYPENYYTPPIQALEEIRIIRGASSLQYGTQFGGLIDFRIKKIPTFKKIEIESSQNYSSFNTFNSFNSIGLNAGKSSINAFYNFKKGDGYRENSEYDSHNAFLSYQYSFSEKTTLSAEFTFFNYLAKQSGGLTDDQFLSNPRLSTRNRNWFKVDWKLFNVFIDHKFSSNSQLSLSLFALDASRSTVGFRGDPRFNNENPITSLDEQNSAGEYLNERDIIAGSFNNIGSEFRYLQKYKIGKRRSVLLLGTKLFKSINESLQGPGSNGTDANFSLMTSQNPNYPNQSNFKLPNTNLSLFTENIFYLTEKFSLTPGLRFEYINTQSEGSYNQIVFDNAGNAIANNLLSDNREISRQFVLGGLGVAYKPSSSFNLIANISQNYRSVTFSDIRVVNPSFIVDPNISDERGLTMDLGVNGRIDKKFSYSYSFYTIRYNDKIGIVLDDRANRVRKNVGDALILGNEFLLNLNLMPLINSENLNFGAKVFCNLALTHSEYLSSEENNVEGNKIEFVPNRNLKCGINLNYKKFNLSYQYTYLSDQFTDVQNSSIALSGDQRSGLVGPIPSYSISDLSLHYRYKNLSFDGGINNLFNRAYYTRRATGYPGPGIIPSEGLSIYLGLSYSWSK